MILYTTKPNTETTPEFAYLGRRSWRWVLEIKPFFIDLCQQIKFEPGNARGYNSEWHPASYYFTLAISKKFKWGSNHVYYNGPHCSFSIGPIHLSWSYWWCKKCLEE